MIRLVSDETRVPVNDRPSLSDDGEARSKKAIKTLISLQLLAVILEETGRKF